MRKLRSFVELFIGLSAWLIGLSSTGGSTDACCGRVGTWMKRRVGQYSEQSGVWTLGVPVPGNTPGVRDYALSWTDNKGQPLALWWINANTQIGRLTQTTQFDPAINVNGHDAAGSKVMVAATARFWSSPKPNCGTKARAELLRTPGRRKYTRVTPPGAKPGLSTANFWLYGGPGL